ncbi:MAG TPA: lipopolysaccharide heptosyltransferase II [Verrucomicrobiae bacterium]|nr:lipopolysaccharide heptosyltransferase II [Verrucomicrobiae bacterium]
MSFPDPRGQTPDPGPRTPDPRRILIRGTNWLGDAVMTTPALLRLREKFPEARITLLTPEKLADLWANHPAVNETISFTPDESIFSVGRKLRAGKFDLALVLPNSPRSAIETWLAKIPQRIGYARPWRNWFLTRAIAPRPDAVRMQKRSIAEIRRLVAADVSRRVTSYGRVLTNAATSAHQIHEYLHLVGSLGANPESIAPQLFVAPDEIEAAKIKFGLEKVAQPVLGLNPGAEYGSAKRWPIERFIAAAKEIQQRTNCVWLILGGKNDVNVANQIESALLAASERSGDGRTPNSHLLNLAGQTSLRELMSLLKLCRVLLTNDSGPMHVAAALGTPVVVPFGSTSLELTGPGLPGDSRHHLLKSDVPCSPCFLRECPIDFRCLNGIAVERVVEAVLSVG